MNFFNDKDQLTQKENQIFFEKIEKLWPIKRLNLGCLKSKYFNY